MSGLSAFFGGGVGGFIGGWTKVNLIELNHVRLTFMFFCSLSLSLPLSLSLSLSRFSCWFATVSFACLFLAGAGGDHPDSEGCESFRRVARSYQKHGNSMPGKNGKMMRN